MNHPTYTDFSLANLPFGIFSTAERSERIGVAIEDKIIDLSALASIISDRGENGWHFDHKVFNQPTLNDFIQLGKKRTNQVRRDLQLWLKDTQSFIHTYPAIQVLQEEATMHLPLDIGDYTDFYSSIEHATNVGKMFRDPENALLPNWKHLPVGYHGRASSIVVSGHPIKRPSGQVMPKGASNPVFEPSERLDFELEMGFVIGKNSQLGHPIPIQQAEEYIFGLVLFNDWSARDIQKWEYVPLGPFLGKSFASSISPWVVPLEAFAPFKTKGPDQNPTPLPYLNASNRFNLDIELEVILVTEGGSATTITRSNFKYMYWSMTQQLTHHTVNGCNVRVGDIMASGTISGPSPNSYGSMLELSWGGKNPIHLKDGSTRTFIEEGDTIIMKGWAGEGDQRVGFGEVSGKVI